MPSTPVMRCGGRPNPTATPPEVVEEDGAPLARGGVEVVGGGGDEGREPFGVGVELVEDLFGVERLAAVSLDDVVGVSEVALDALAQDFRVGGVGDAYAAPSGLVLVGRADAAQRRADALV